MPDTIRSQDTSATLSDLDLPRVLGHRVGSQPGPTLICIASLHGNEPAGLHGIRQVLADLGDAPKGLRGTVLALLGNRPALRAGTRYVEHDLNRIWTSARLRALRGGAAATTPEEEELRELDREIQAALREANGPVKVLDLHTTSAPGPSFVVLNDSLANRAFALSFPVPVVLGLEEELEGTLLNYLTGEPQLTSIGFESGQHEDPESADRAAAAIWLALEAGGLLDAHDWPQIADAHTLLDAEGQGLPPMVDVHYRHQIEAVDGFRMRPGYAGFQPVEVGDVIADDHRGAIAAPQSGLLLMPLYQGQGEDGFFIVRQIRPIWLRLSAILRRMHLEGIVRLLPGVHKHPTIPQAVTVDRKVARYLALELFHLLGFSRVSDNEDRILVMRRRSIRRLGFDHDDAGRVGGSSSPSADG